MDKSGAWMKLLAWLCPNVLKSTRAALFKLANLLTYRLCLIWMTTEVRKSPICRFTERFILNCLIAQSTNFLLNCYLSSCLHLFQVFMLS